MAEQIIILIAPDGTTTVETKGFTGSACLTATKELKAALGTVTGETPTGEMRQTPAGQRAIAGTGA